MDAKQKKIEEAQAFLLPSQKAKLKNIKSIGLGGSRMVSGRAMNIRLADLPLGQGMTGIEASLM